MVGTTQRNHYETLGIAPGATAAEIERAYAMELLRPRAFGGLAQIGIAYATLSDAAKRAAYDEAIGVARKPAMVLAPAFGNWMTAAVHVGPTVQSRASPEAAAPAVAAPAGESFVAASLRALAAPEPLVRPATDPMRQADVPARAAPPVPEAPLLDDGAPVTAIDWRRPATIGGGLTLAAILFGAWAGSAVRDPEAPLQAETAVTMPVPTAKASAKADEPAPVEIAQAAPVRVAARRAERRAAPAPAPRPVALTAAEEQALAGGAFVDSATAQAASAAGTVAQELAAAPTVMAAAASLPLSGRTVARTIGRIGYACGSVSSIAAAGSPGVFKVTCASGDAYQARPVRGRYHFRRWGRN